MFKKAFTLSEVLIVIGIIGIVSVLTVPTVINSADRNTTITKLQKVHNELNAAFQQAIAKYGDSAEWGTIYATNINRIYEFLDIKHCNVTFPSDKYTLSGYPICELKDGTIIASSGLAIYVALDGKDGNVSGESIFGFDVYYNLGDIQPFGYNSDKKNDNALNYGTDLINATNWAITNGNLDYLDCPDSLNWETQLTCK